MTAVDTNVVVRLLTEDDPKQAAAARSLFGSGPIWIAKTVLLEAGWVLRSLYGFEESAIHAAFSKLHAEDESSVVAALALTAHGIEFADAMHLSSRPPGSTFVSFDKSFVRDARRAGASKVSGVAASSVSGGSGGAHIHEK
jgi:predicted nucleic-acid-binding protein